MNNGKKMFLLLTGFTIMSAMLPSFLTQYNWMQPNGLADYEKRKKILTLSWLATIVLLIILWHYAKSE